MVKVFGKIAILGGGLLGGSLALALQGRMRTGLWSRRGEATRQALELGIEGATSNLADALNGAELVILCVPVGVMRGLLTDAIEAGMDRDALVTDVGSVKAMVHRELAPLCSEQGIRFIGGHPMAGSERRGIEASEPGLFEGAACILTDEGGVGDPDRGRLEAFWRELGCRTRWMRAREHDKLVARISHFPHAMASATAMVGLVRAEDAEFGGGGLRDTTRVAGGDPAMWAEILIENREAVGCELESARRELGELLAMLERADHQAVRDWLELARDRHAAGRSFREGRMANPDTKE